MRRLFSTRLSASIRCSVFMRLPVARIGFEYVSSNVAGPLVSGAFGSATGRRRSTAGDLAQQRIDRPQASAAGGERARPKPVQCFLMDKINSTPRAQGGALAASAGRRIVLPVQGMTCASCVAHVEKALGRVPGVERTAVNLATETAAIEGAPDIGALQSAVI